MGLFIIADLIIIKLFCKVVKAFRLHLEEDMDAVIDLVGWDEAINIQFHLRDLFSTDRRGHSPGFSPQMNRNQMSNLQPRLTIQISNYVEEDI